MANKPLVSIVILNWNGLEDTKLCIEHTLKQTYSNYEIIIVDNGSSKAQKKYLSKLENIIYVDNKTNKGFTGGHIDGLAHANGDYILLFNNDAVPKSDYVEKAVEILQNNPEAAAVGGRAYFWNDNEELFDESNNFYSYQEIDLYTGEARSLQSDAGQIQEVNNVSGSAVLVRKDVIDKIGYLYEPFFAYFEETDLFARTKRAGYKVLYSPNLKIWHRNGGSSGSTSGSYFFYYQIFRNRYIFAIRNFQASYLPAFLKNYLKISLKSLARRYFRKSSDETINKAYSNAALTSLLSTPRLLLSRHKLANLLGPSDYNTLIFKEQKGVSIVVDATIATEEEIKSFIAKVSHDKNILHEYIIVTKEVKGIYRDENSKRIRFVVDKGWLHSAPINIGIIASRYDWVLLTNKLSGIDQTITQQYHDVISEQNQHHNIEVVSLNKSSLAITKRFYQYIGGVKNEKSFEGNLIDIIGYATVFKNIYSRVRQKNVSDKKLLEYKKNRTEFELLSNERKVTLFKKISNRYYRIKQSASIAEWLFMSSIPVRLKIARIKNLIVFTLMLRKNKLATEIKHIMNEVVLNSGDSLQLKQRKEIINEQLAASLQDHSTIPVFIICFERVEGLKLLVSWLETHNLRNIIFLDNDSTYPPLVEYLNSSPYQKIRMNRNIGHTAAWTLDVIKILTPDQFYIVTDPDVIPTENCPGDIINYLLKVHEKFLPYQKVGLGLKINDLPDHYPLRKSVIKWEEQFWITKLDKGIYDAGVDTTFALYKPFTYNYILHPSIRIGEPYTARHLPWYSDPTKPTEEDVYYRLRANSNITSWNVDELPDRYKKELDKQAP